MTKEQFAIRDKVLLFVQLNDLYQIDTSADYTDEDALILPRISTYVKSLRDIYGPDRVRFCLPGDFLAPSCLSKKFKGKQIVDILNRIGVDLVSFGNHEFERDIKTRNLVARMRESRFKWLNANFEFRDETLQDRLEKSGKMVMSEWLSLSDTHRVCLFGVLNAKSLDHVGWVHDKPEDFVRIIVEQVRDAQEELANEALPRRMGVTFVGMTHQKLDDDRKLAQELPQIALIMGAHDHDVIVREPVGRCLIVKAVSNARTLRLNWLVAIPLNSAEGVAPPDRRADPEAFRKFALDVYGRIAVKGMRDALLQTRKPSVQQIQDLRDFLAGGVADPNFEIHGVVDGEELILIFSIALNTASAAFGRLVPADADVYQRVRQWNRKAKHSEKPLITAPDRLVVIDTAVRRYSTNFGNFIADIIRGLPILHNAPRLQADVGLINSGSFRIDRDIQPGEVISQRTLCDVFYHRNAINHYELKGQDLIELLQNSVNLRNDDRKKGDGNFLQISGLRVSVPAEGSPISVYKVGDFGKEEPIGPTRSYTVATTAYVAKSAFPAHFKKQHKGQLHPDVSACVENVLRDLDLSVLESVLTDDDRWQFDERDPTLV